MSILWGLNARHQRVRIWKMALPGYAISIDHKNITKECGHLNHYSKVSQKRRHGYTLSCMPAASLNKEAPRDYLDILLPVIQQPFERGIGIINLPLVCVLRSLHAWICQLGFQHQGLLSLLISSPSASNLPCRSGQSAIVLQENPPIQVTSSIELQQCLEQAIRSKR